MEVDPENQKREVELAIDQDEEIRFGRKMTFILSAISFIIALVFWSGNITGNVVGDMTKGDANILGAGLFVLSIIGFFKFSKK